ncbi:MAG: hypothetical protein V1772_08190 [Chloroflexota bacterium]
MTVGICLFYYLPLLVEKDLLWLSRYLRYPSSARWSVAPALMADLLVRRWSPSFDPMGWDVMPVFPNMTCYLGGVACLLALVGAVRLRSWARVLPLVGMLGASLLLAAAGTIPNNPAYWVVRRIPFIADSVRNAFRYLWPASAALAALAGLGVERLLPPAASLARRLAVPAVALALILVDLGPLTQAYGTVAAYMEPEEIAAHTWLDQTPGDERYWVPFEIERYGRHYADTSYGVRYNRRAHVSDNEYHRPSAPLRATALYGEALRNQIERTLGLSAAAQAILDVANVRYMLLYLWPERYADALERLLASGRWRLVQRGEEVALLENLTVRPYVQAYAAGALAVALDHGLVPAALPTLLAQGHALVEEPEGESATAALPAGLARAWQPGEILPHAAPPTVALSMARPKAGAVWVKYEAEAPFLLMISETWYPHWQVWVNGERRPLLRLNGAYLGVAVSEPRGPVLFRYRRPWYHWLGHAVSALTAVLVALFLARRQPVRLRPDA